MFDQQNISGDYTPPTSHPINFFIVLLIFVLFIPGGIKGLPFVVPKIFWAGESEMRRQRSIRSGP